MGQVIQLTKAFGTDDFQEWEWQSRLSLQYPPYKVADYSGVNVVNNNGQTRLIRAAEKSDNAGITRYLAEGANPNLEVVSMVGPRVIYAGSNALIETIRQENLEGARLLLAAKANPNKCVFRTQGGNGTYTIYPTDFFETASSKMQALLREYDIDTNRQGELARMRAYERKHSGTQPNV